MEDARVHVMTLDEMAQAAPIAASEPEPPALQALRTEEPALYALSDTEPEVRIAIERVGGSPAAESIWRVAVRARRGRILPGPPVLEADRVDARTLLAADTTPATPGYRPLWAAVEYLPRLLPHRVIRSSRALRVRRVARSGPMRLLSNHNHEALSNAYPWRCFGKVFTGGDAGWDGGGSGVLVGPNLMMTASHVWPWGKRGRWMLFSPGFRDGRQHPDSFVTRVRGVRVTGESDPSGYDYVICQLQKPLGEMLGWLGSQWWSRESHYYGNRWTSVGYPSWFFSGMRPAAELDIAIVDIDSDDPGLELETTFNTAAGGGWSGGPLWGVVNDDFRVIGIKSGWEVDVYDPGRGVFAGGKLMVELIKHGLAHFQ